jgi:hypothetical protein
MMMGLIFAMKDRTFLKAADRAIVFGWMEVRFKELVQDARRH